LPFSVAPDDASQAQGQHGLSQAGKNIKLVCVAIARELVGFIWDIVRHEMPRLAPQRSAVAG
jgi:hypothetical protein